MSPVVDLAGGDLTGAGGRKLEALGALAFHPERDLLDVEDDVGDVLANSREARELVEHAFDLDRGDSGALQRAQEHAAQRVAQGHAEAALQRFCDEHGLAAGVAGALLALQRVRLLQFLPVLCVDGHFHPLAVGGLNP